MTWRSPIYAECTLLPQLFRQIFAVGVLVTYYYYYICFKAIDVCNANSVDPDQTTRSAASDLCLYFLPMPILWRKYKLMYYEVRRGLSVDAIKCTVQCNLSTKAHKTCCCKEVAIIQRLNIEKWLLLCEMEIAVVERLPLVEVPLHINQTAWTHRLSLAFPVKICLRRMLTLVLLNPDIPCLCKQCRSRSVATDLDLHCLSLSMWININILDQVIWLGENQKWVWHLNLFSRTRVKALT